MPIDIPVAYTKSGPAPLEAFTPQQVLPAGDAPTFTRGIGDRPLYSPGTSHARCAAGAMGLAAAMVLAAGVTGGRDGII